MQPGTILTTGLELGALADVRVQPDTQTSQIVKRARKNDDFIAPTTEPVALTTPFKAIASGKSALQAIQQESRPSANPAIHQPEAAPYDTFKVGNRTVKRTVVQTHAVTPTLVQRDFGGIVGGHADTVVRPDQVDQSSGEGTRSGPFFATFDAPGTERADGVNDVSGGVGAFALDTYTVGFQGRVGTIKRYDLTGALEASTIFAFSPGNRVQLHGVDSNSTGVYVVGREVTSGGALVSNFVHKVSSALGGVVPVASRLHDYPAGSGVVTLEDIHVNSFDGDVHVTGIGDAGVGHDVVIDFRYNDDPVLSVEIEQTVDFGGDGEGHSVATDAVTGTRVIGMSLDPGDGIHRPGYFAVLNDNVNVPYAFVTDGGSPTDKATNAMFGVEITGPDLWLSGSVADNVFNPAISPDPDNYDNLLVAKADVLTGSLFTYSFIYGISGGDYLSHGSGIDESTGNHYTGGWADSEALQTNSQTMSFGDISEFDQSGNLISFRTWGDIDNAPLDKDSDGMGVSVLPGGTLLSSDTEAVRLLGGTRAPATGVATGGRTNAGDADSANPVSPLTCCDIVFGIGGGGNQGPPTDGFAMVDGVPLGLAPGSGIA